MTAPATKKKNIRLPRKQRRREAAPANAAQRYERTSASTKVVTETVACRQRESLTSCTARWTSIISDERPLTRRGDKTPLELS